MRSFNCDASLFYDSISLNLMFCINYYSNLRSFNNEDKSLVTIN